MVSKTEHTNGPLLAKSVSQFYCSCHTFPQVHCLETQKEAMHGGHI